MKNGKKIATNLQKKKYQVMAMHRLCCWCNKSTLNENENIAEKSMQFSE